MKLLLDTKVRNTVENHKWARLVIMSLLGLFVERSPAIYEFFEIKAYPNRHQEPAGYIPPEPTPK